MKVILKSFFIELLKKDDPEDILDLINDFAKEYQIDFKENPKEKIGFYEILSLIEGIVNKQIHLKEKGVILRDQY